MSEQEVVKPLPRWGSHVSLEVLSVSHENRLGAEELLRDALRLGLRSISEKVTLRTEQGEYAFAIPAKITVRLEQNNLDFRLALECSSEIQDVVPNT